MYIVLTAMLALNVSSDVLDGFVQVEDGLARTNVNVIERNDALYSRLERIAADNPEKGSRWLDKASDVRRRAGELYRHVDTLKLAMIRYRISANFSYASAQRAFGFKLYR